MKRNLLWIKWQFAAWLASETRYSQSACERGIYRDALDLCYAEGSIPSDRDTLIRLLAITPEEFGAAWPKVSKKFVPHPELPDRLINPRVAEVLAEAEVYSRKQARNGRKGGLVGGQKPARSRRKASAKQVPSDCLANAKPEVSHTEKEEDKEKNTARSLNGAARVPVSCPEWFKAIWSAYPTERRGSKKEAYKQAQKALPTDPDRSAALSLLQRRLEHRANLKAAGVWIPELKDLERYFSKGVYLQPPEEDLPELPGSKTDESYGAKLTWEEVDRRNREIEEIKAKRRAGTEAVQ